MDSELTAVGWPPPSRRRNDEGRAERLETGRRLRKLYDAGRSLREIAAETGYSYGYVHTCLRLAGVKMRGRGSNKFPGRVISL